MHSSQILKFTCAQIMLVKYKILYTYIYIYFVLIKYKVIYLIWPSLPHAQADFQVFRASTCLAQQPEMPQEHF